MGRSEISCRILQSAREEFKTKGYENASMREIAQRVGYTMGVLYSRYKDKEELFSAVVKFGEMAIEDKIAGETVTSTNTPVTSSVVKRSRNDVVNRLFSIMDTVYKYKDTFELLIRCSKGSSKENYIEDFVDRERVLKSYLFNCLTSKGVSNNIMLSSLSRNLAVAIYRTLFYSALDLPQKDVVKFIDSSLID